MNRIRLEFSVYYQVDDSVHSATITNDGFECATLPTLDEVYDSTIVRIKPYGEFNLSKLESFISYLLLGEVDIANFIETLEEKGFDTETLIALVNQGWWYKSFTIYDWVINALDYCVIFKDLKSFETWEEIALDLETFENWDIIPVGEKLLVLRKELEW